MLNAQKEGYQSIVAGLYQSLKGFGNIVVDDELVITWTSKNSTLPVFAFWDFSVGKEKALGGLVLSGDEQGSVAASLIKDILEKNKAISSIDPVTTPNGSLFFSRNQLERFKLSLPASMKEQTRFVD